MAFFQNRSASDVLVGGGQGERRNLLSGKSAAVMSISKNQWNTLPSLCPLFSPLIFKILNLLLSKKPFPFFKKFLPRVSALARPCSSNTHSSCMKFGTVCISNSRVGLVVMKVLLHFSVCLFVFIIKISLYLVQTFFSFIKSNVIDCLGMECLQFPKCMTCLHLQKPGS